MTTDRKIEDYSVGNLPAYVSHESVDSASRNIQMTRVLLGQIA